MFYGWRIVAVCLVAALFANAFGLFGAGVYLNAIVSTQGWPTGLVSGAVTLFYLTSALLLMPVGSFIAHLGPRPVMGCGIVAMAAGIVALGRCDEPWQVYAAFGAMGVGWSSLSTTAQATTIAPWFDRHQGRAVSIASLGASAGGMIGPAALLLGVAHLGLAWTTTLAAAVSFAVLMPLILLVLKHRPQDIGLGPDGASGVPSIASRPATRWTRAQALRSWALRSVMISFGTGMLVQIGFVTHQVTLLLPALGTTGTSLTAAATAVAALCSRLLLVRFSDQIDQRKVATGVLVAAALAYGAMGIFPAAAVLVAGSVLYGVTVGNVTTLAPIIVRREFGAATFGPIFGVASMAIQLCAAIGPGLYGLLHDWSGSYRLPLLLVALLDIVASIVLLSGRSRSGS